MRRKGRYGEEDLGLQLPAVPGDSLPQNQPTNIVTTRDLSRNNAHRARAQVDQHLPL